MKNITPIILILASVGLFFGYINPTYTAVTGAADPSGKSIQELQIEEGDYQDALGKTREIEVVRNGLLSKFNSLKDSDKERIAKLLPDHIDSVRLIIDINNIAARYGMSLTNIVLTASGVLPAVPKAVATGAAAGTPSAPTGAAFVGPDDRSYDSIKLGFTVTGSYENFIQFLKEIEESLRVVDVTSLVFSTAKPTASSGQGAAVSSASVSTPYTYAVTIRTYYLK